MVAFHLWAAIRTVKDRIGTWRGYEQYRVLDPSITREQWATTVAQARAALANRTDEITRPLNRRPTQGEITLYASRRASGYLQQLQIFVRDRDTGMVETRHYNIRSDTLRSRQAIVDEGMRRYQSAADSDPENYPEDVVGAIYVGTHLMQPAG